MFLKNLPKNFLNLTSELKAGGLALLLIRIGKSHLVTEIKKVFERLLGPVMQLIINKLTEKVRIDVKQSPYFNSVSSALDDPSFDGELRRERILFTLRKTNSWF